MNFLFLAIMAIFASPDSSYTLTGTVEGLDKGMAYIEHETTTKHTDSVRILKGHFQFTGTIGDPELCQIAIAGPAKNTEYGPLFFLERGSLQIKGRVTDIRSAVISGGPMQADLLKFTAEQKAAGDYPKQKAAAKVFVLHRPSSLVSAYALLLNYSYNPDADELDSLYNGLDGPVRNSFVGMKVKEVLEGAKLTAIGKPAPAFTQPDMNGKPLDLSSFQGSYVLIDFWASWCGPCRLENPNVIKTYDRYRAKGFAILGVSLDEQKDKWLDAIKKDRLVWTQVSDLKGWENQAAVLYGIKGIPMNYLLDKNGKIIAKGLMGDALEKKLAELLP